ncbi:hypothetical protein BO85DRAFT_121609 [Aspergillus piperis CBS 112811]|uniref:Uncharacterized protein n=1 Tax=Aspergillus piperis CBS 112811 TaxID=1448313 RepID=A0A8G1VRI3_9EURO|nr:hypothetical protein BO85DRAFT_121609 [Aspergillus piperis CBS 112811]RAH61940.1 hypothetical protein BO85DRAFT_121609 [Aspergillus piperis CBS 112811]
MRRGRYPVRGAPVMAAHASGPIAYGIYTYQLSMDWRDTPGPSGHDVHFTHTLTLHPVYIGFFFHCLFTFLHNTPHLLDLHQYLDELSFSASQYS